MRKHRTRYIPLLESGETLLYVSVFAKALSVFVLILIVPLEFVLSRSLQLLELPLISKLQEIGEYRWLNELMSLLALTAQSEILLILAPALYHIENPRKGTKIILIGCFTIYVQSLLELLYAEPRPFWMSSAVHAFNCEGGFGHPSALILHTTLFYCYAYFQLRQSTLNNYGLLALWISVLAFSRVYSGNNFIYQVVSSLALSFFLVVVILASDDWLNALVYKSAFNYRRYRKYTVYWLFVTLGLLVVAVVVVINVNYPFRWHKLSNPECSFNTYEVRSWTFQRVAYVFYNYGVMAGSMNTHKLLPGSWWRTQTWKRLIRFTMALAGSVGVCFLFSKSLVEQIQVHDAVTEFVFHGAVPYFINGFYISGVVPWAAKMLKLSRQPPF